MKTLLSRQMGALLLSAMMVLEAPVRAQGWDTIRSQGADNFHEGQLPAVVFEPITTPDGETAYLALAQVGTADEATVVSELVQHNPEATSVVVSGTQDPAYQAAAKLAEFSRTNVFVAESLDKNPLLTNSAAPATLREKIKAKIKAVTDHCKKSKTGLMGAIIYSTAMASIGTFYFSAGIGAGLQILGGLFIAYALIATRSHDWERLMAFPGNLATKLLTAAFGQPSDKTKHVLKVLGTALATWAVGTMMSSFVFYMSGHLESFWQVAYFALIGNYSVLDSGVIRKAESGVISEETKDRYFMWQFLIGTILECMGIAQVPGMQALLGTASVSGLLYMLIGEEKVDGVIVSKFTAAVRRARKPIRKLKVKTCELRLGGVSALVTKIPRSKRDRGQQ